MKYLIQVNVNGSGEWTTVAKRGTFQAAKTKANREFREMKGAHEVSIIREDDLDAPILRRLRGNNYELC